MKSTGRGHGCGVWYGVGYNRRVRFFSFVTPETKAWDRSHQQFTIHLTTLKRDPELDEDTELRIN